MPATFDIVAEIIVRTCETPRERITPDCDLLSDLGIDSLDLLDVAFAIDGAFGIELPLDRWLHAVRLGRPPSNHYFIMREFCDNIDTLIVAATAFRGDPTASCAT